MSVKELQATSDAREFAEWCAFQRIDPTSEDRADWRAAQICAIVANTLRGEKEPAIPVETFMPFTDGQRPKRNLDDVERDILRWARRRARGS